MYIRNKRYGDGLRVWDTSPRLECIDFMLCRSISTLGYRGSIEMKVIDLKKPMTGIIYDKSPVSFWIDWHNGTTQRINKEKMKAAMFMGEKRFMFLERPLHGNKR